MDDEVMKLECLKLAQGDTLKAQKLFNFIKGRSENFGTDIIGGGRARVVGKDGDLPDYIRDPDAKPL